jgi:hypothetical protein
MIGFGLVCLAVAMTACDIKADECDGLDVDVGLVDLVDCESPDTAVPSDEDSGVVDTAQDCELTDAYVDRDGDGYPAESPETVCQDDPDIFEGDVPDDRDCNDENADYNPGQPDYLDNFDHNCDGEEPDPILLTTMSSGMPDQVNGTVELSVAGETAFLNGYSFDTLCSSVVVEAGVQSTRVVGVRDDWLMLDVMAGTGEISLSTAQAQHCAIDPATGLIYVIGAEGDGSIWVDVVDPDTVQVTDLLTTDFVGVTDLFYAESGLHAVSEGALYRYQAEEDSMVWEPLFEYSGEYGEMVAAIPSWDAYFFLTDIGYLFYSTENGTMEIAWAEPFPSSSMTQLIWLTSTTFAASSAEGVWTLDVTGSESLEVLYAAEADTTLNALVSGNLVSWTDGGFHSWSGASQ